MSKSNINIKYKCIGASKQVTGSCHMLSINVKNNNYNIIVDVGQIQNQIMNMSDLYNVNKAYKDVNWESIDAIFATHGHLDHCGNLPIPFMQDYDGYIYSTAPTAEIAQLILTDSAYIQDRETEKYNKTQKGKKNPIYPIYGTRQVDRAIERFRGYDYNTPIVLTENITVTLKPTGHLLGACSIYIEIKYEQETKRIMFSGDTSAGKVLPFTMLPDFKDIKLDTLIMEGTYGDRIHDDLNNTEIFTNMIKKICIDNKGQLMIPVFSVGRSTSVIAQLYDLYKDNPEFINIPVYLASPMSCRSHGIYCQRDSFNFYNESDKKYKDIFNWEQVTYIESYDEVESKLLNKEPKIILASAGMISGGYAISVASSILPNKKNGILFVGYQGEGTSGRNILESKYGESISIDSKSIKRKCQLESISMSSHADYNQIIDMIKTMRHTKIKSIILNHGNEDTLNTFKNHLEKEFKADIIIAEKNKGYNL